METIIAQRVKLGAIPRGGKKILEIFKTLIPSSDEASLELFCFTESVYVQFLIEE